MLKRTKFAFIYSFFKNLHRFDFTFFQNLKLLLSHDAQQSKRKVRIFFERQSCHFLYCSVTVAMVIVVHSIEMNSYILNCYVILLSNKSKLFKLVKFEHLELVLLPRLKKISQQIFNQS